MLRNKLATIALGLASALGAVPAHATPVGLELVLLVDVSGSVDNTEYNLQRQGYIDAFNNAATWNAISQSQLGSIAVTYIEWSSAAQQSVRVGWTLIDSLATSQAFATAILGTTRAFSGSTAPGSAINFATPLFGTETGGAGNGFESLRQVIDVSGDGAQNDGASTATARTAALSAGVDAINGLPILGEAGLLAFYQNNIQGGAGSFTIPANNFADFGAAVQNKLTTEITGVPEPGSLALLGIALAGMAAFRRRG